MVQELYLYQHIHHMQATQLHSRQLLTSCYVVCISALLGAVIEFMYCSSITSAIPVSQSAATS